MFECIKKLFAKKESASITPVAVVVPYEHTPGGIEVRKINLKPAYEMIKSFEGCVLTAYPDPGTGGDPWTIGWGHTGTDVYPGLKINQAQADMLFEDDIYPRVEELKKMLKRPYTDNQFCALLSFGYNCGMSALQRSTLLVYFNRGEIFLASEQFKLWVNGGSGPMPGLVRRREAERKLFLT